VTSYALLNAYANPEIKAFITYTSEYIRIQLVWVPGHMGIDGNEIAAQLARQVSP
jgi:ribonuclease HI